MIGKTIPLYEVADPPPFRYSMVGVTRRVFHIADRCGSPRKGVTVARFSWLVDSPSTCAVRTVLTLVRLAHQQRYHGSNAVIKMVDFLVTLISALDAINCVSYLC